MSNNTVELMEPWGYDLAAAVLCVVQCLGFTLNLFVIVLMCRDAQVATELIVQISMYEMAYFTDLESHQRNYIQFGIV